MAGDYGAAPALAGSASDNARPDRAGSLNAALASFLADSLTVPMREALRARQDDLFGPPVITGAGVTLKALRRRGIIEGKAVPRVTLLGELVIGAARLVAEPPDAARAPPGTPTADGSSAGTLTHPTA